MLLQRLVAGLVLDGLSLVIDIFWFDNKLDSIWIDSLWEFIIISSLFFAN